MCTSKQETVPLVEEKMKEFDTFHLDGRYFHKTPKQLRDWLRTTLLAYGAEREASGRKAERERVKLLMFDYIEKGMGFSKGSINDDMYQRLKKKALTPTKE